MDNTNIIEKPCIVPAKQGFSVSYKQRFLYSKYNPSKLIIDKVSELTILPGTIFLCNSAILEYGIIELYSKLSENCLLILCEFDIELHKLMKDTFEQIKNKIPNCQIILPTIEELFLLPNIIHKSNYVFNCGYNFKSLGFYKRFVRIDFSAGTFFNEKLYDELNVVSVNSIKTFWTNRVTLVKFGRKYSYNLFKNLKKINKTLPISNYFNKIEKPIIVFGAGQTLEKDIETIKSKREQFYILCADTALQPLLKHKITPNGVFIEEAQNVIKKAFLGSSKEDFRLFAGISSIPELSEYIDISKISYFTSLYTNANFLENLKRKEILPYQNMPFGSVGITTMFYATKFRKDDSVPIFYYGLDFSYSAGYTHSRNTIAHIGRLCKSNRIFKVENYNAAFSATSTKLSKNNSCFSTPVLLNYKNLFDSLFSEEKNIYKNEFKISDNGIDSQIKIEKNTHNKNVATYLVEEKEKLVRIKNILTGEEQLESEMIEETLTQLITSSDYLYLHFPDGWQFNFTQSFLNRIRNEVNFFLKLYE